jgi:hypothetical protein
MNVAVAWQHAGSGDRTADAELNLSTPKPCTLDMITII